MTVPFLAGGIFFGIVGAIGALKATKVGKTAEKILYFIVFGLALANIGYAAYLAASNLAAQYTNPTEELLAASYLLGMITGTF